MVIVIYQVRVYWYSVRIKTDDHIGPGMHKNSFVCVCGKLSKKVLSMAEFDTKQKFTKMKLGCFDTRRNLSSITSVKGNMYYEYESSQMSRMLALIVRFIDLHTPFQFNIADMYHQKGEVAYILSSTDQSMYDKKECY